MNNNFVYIDKDVLHNCISLLGKYKTGNYMNVINVNEVENYSLELIQAINSLGSYLQDKQFETILLKRELNKLA